MSNKNMKNCAKPLIIKEVQITATIRYPLTSTRITAIKMANNKFQ